MLAVITSLKYHKPKWLQVEYNKNQIDSTHLRHDPNYKLRIIKIRGNCTLPTYDLASFNTTRGLKAIT